MDWIERYVGVNPDAGSGALEWALLAIAAGVVIEVARRVRRRLRARASQPTLERIRG